MMCGNEEVNKGEEYHIERMIYRIQSTSSMR